MKQVLVIIPTYNEVDNIEPMVVAIQQVAKDLKAHELSLLVVDDYSPDGTGTRVEQLSQDYSNIQLLSGRKAGLGRAYLRGFKYALSQPNYDVFVMMDADLSHDPKDIPVLLAAIDEGADYVIGSRYTEGGSVASDWSLYRRLVSRTANYSVRKLVGEFANVADLTAGFKAIRRQALEKIELDSLNARGYVFNVSLLHSILEQGSKVKEVPIKFKARNRGSSKMKLRDIVEFLYRAYKLSPNAPIQRLVRFVFVGSCGAVVNLLILTVLVKFGRIETLVAVLVAIEASIIFNFFLNHYYTFRGYGSFTGPIKNVNAPNVLLKLGIFNLGAAGGAVISFTVFALLFKLLNVEYILADIIAILVATSWNYWMSTRFVWRAIDLMNIGD